MDKTPKLKSRTLGFRSRGQKITALAFKELECESKEHTNSRHLLKRNKKTEPDKDVILCVKESRLNGINEMVTPVKTQVLPSHDNESPDLKQESPVLQSNYLSTFGSPEVEVSWDYSCSQAPKESVAPAVGVKQRRRRFPKALPPLLNLQPRLVPTIEMSEEEQKKQIDCLKGFYKELLNSEDSTSSSSSSSPTKSQNEMKDITVQQTVSNQCVILNKTECMEDQNEALLNDSSNDIMFACTQVVENELFENSQVPDNKCLQMPPESDINMNCNVKQPRNTSFTKYNSCAKTKLFSDSSGFENGNNQTNLKLDNESKLKDVRYVNNGHHKSSPEIIIKNQGCVRHKVKKEEPSTSEENKGLQRVPKCNNFNSETNLNTEGNTDDIYSLFDDSIDEMMAKCSQDVEEQLLSQESKKTDVEQNVPKKHSASPLVKCSKVSKTNYKQTVHAQDSSRTGELYRPCANINLCVNKQQLDKDLKLNGSTDEINRPINVQRFDRVKVGSSRECQAPAKAHTKGINKPKDADISALLNDNDAYLTSIDLSSIDTASAAGIHVAPLNMSATQKIYSEHEIEVKRIEALNKLRRKREKT